MLPGDGEAGENVQGTVGRSSRAGGAGRVGRSVLPIGGGTLWGQRVERHPLVCSGTNARTYRTRASAHTFARTQATSSSRKAAFPMIVDEGDHRLNGRSSGLTRSGAGLSHPPDKRPLAARRYRGGTE